MNPPSHLPTPPSVPNPITPLSLSAQLMATAAAAAGSQQYPPASLYVVATPIGNLADLSLRAIHVLGLVDAVACEDSRVSAGLMSHLGLHKPLLAVHEHNERSAAQAVLARLNAGERVAYVSDAGTPAVSDPGAALVAIVRAAGHRCVPVPGASSVACAISVAGVVEWERESAGGYRFVGFLPSKAGARRDALAALVMDPSTLVLFEAPHRVAALADALALACPERMITLGRELTKQFESIHAVAARDLPGWIAADAHRERGEWVLVLHALPTEAASQTVDRHDAILRPLLQALPLKQAVAVAVEVTGAPRNALYERALELQKQNPQ